MASSTTITPGSWVWVMDADGVNEIGAHVTCCDGNMISTVTTSSTIIEAAFASARPMSSESMYAVTDLALLPNQDQTVGAWAHNLWVHYARRELNVAINDSASITLCPPPAGSEVPLSDLPATSPLYQSLSRPHANGIAIVGSAAHHSLNLVLNSLVQLGLLDRSVRPKLESAISILSTVCGMSNTFSAFMVELQGPTSFKIASSPELLCLLADKTTPCFNVFFDLLGVKSVYELQQLGVNQPLDTYPLLSQRPFIVPNLDRPVQFANALQRLGLSGLTPQLEKMAAAILLLSSLDFMPRPGTNVVQCARDPSCLSYVASLLQVTSGFESSIFNPPLESGLLQVPAAIEQRDQAVLGLYTCMVNWTIAYVNQMCAFNLTAGLPPPTSKTLFVFNNQHEVDLALDFYHGRIASMNGTLNAKLFANVGTGHPHAAAALRPPSQGVVLSGNPYITFAIPVSGTANLNVAEIRGPLAPLLRSAGLGPSQPRRRRGLSFRSQPTSVTNSQSNVASAPDSSVPPPPAWLASNSTGATQPLSSNGRLDSDDPEETAKREREDRLLEYLERTEAQRNENVRARLHQQIQENKSLMDKVQAYPADLQSLLAVVPPLVQQLACDTTSASHLPCPITAPTVPTIENPPALMPLQPNQIVRTALSQKLKGFEKYIIINYILKSIQGFGVQEVDRLFTTCLDNATLFPDAWRYMAAFSCAVTPSAPVQAAVICQYGLVSAPRHLLELMLTNWAIRQAPRQYGITYIETNSIWTDTQLKLIINWADNVTIPVNLHPAQQVSSIVQCLISWRQIPVPVNEYTLCLSGLGIDLRLSPLDSFFDLLCLYQQLYETGTITIRIERLFVPPITAIPGLATPSPIQADRALCHMQLASKYPDLVSNGDEAVQRAQDTGLWAMRFPAHLPSSPKDTLHAYWIVCTKSGFVVERMHRLGTEVALACRWDDFVVVGATPHNITLFIEGANHVVDCSGSKVADFVNTWIASIRSSVAVMLGEYTSREGTRCPKAAVVQVQDERLPWVLITSQFPAIPQTWVPRTHLEYLVDATRAAAATRGELPLRISIAMRQIETPGVDTAQLLMQGMSLNNTANSAQASPVSQARRGSKQSNAFSTPDLSVIGSRDPSPAPPGARTPSPMAPVQQRLSEGFGTVMGGTIKKRAPAPPQGGGSPSSSTYSPGSGNSSLAGTMVGVPQGLSGHFGSQGTIGRHEGGTPRSRRATDSAGDAKVVTVMDVPKLASLQLGDHSMEQFASQAFETKSGTIFGKKKNAFDSKSLEYSDSQLRKPLTRAAYGDTRDAKLACDISGWILAFMGDVKSKSPLETVKNIIDTALTNPSTLVDETYCQVIKQINQNPRPEGVQQGLRLLAICGVFLLPSSELFPALCRFLQQLVRSNSSLADQAEMAYANMYKTSRLSPRNLGPSREELEALNANALIKFRVEMPDRTARAFLIDSFSLCSDIIIKIEDKYQTGDFSKAYSLVLDCGPRSGAQPLLMVPILESDRLADFLTFAENLTRKRDTEKADASSTDSEVKYSTKPRIEAPRIVYTRLFWSTKGAGAARTHRAIDDGKAGDKDKSKPGPNGSSLPTLQQRSGYDNHLPPIPQDLPPYYSSELLEWTFAQLRTAFLNGDLFSAAELKPNAQQEITYLMSLLAIVTAPEDLKDVIPVPVKERNENTIVVLKANIENQMNDWKDAMSAILAPAGAGDDGSAPRARSSSNMLRSGMGTMRGQSPVKAVPTAKLVEAAKRQFLDRIRVTFQFFGTLGIHVYGAADARFADGGLLLVGDQGVFILDEKNRKVVITIEYDELADITTEGEEVTIRTQNMLQKRIIRFLTAQHHVLFEVIQRYKNQYQLAKREEKQLKSSANNLAAGGSMPNLLNDEGMRGPGGVMG